jgi:cytochrome c-type biogenesis protein CcmE
MRVSGNVRAGSISHADGRINFVLEEQGKDLPVSYVGRDPLPDTFKDGAQALVEGRLMPQGFVAEGVQAKCASKYEATPPGSTAGAKRSAPPVDQSTTEPSVPSSGRKS